MRKSLLQNSKNQQKLSYLKTIIMAENIKIKKQVGKKIQLNQPQSHIVFQNATSAPMFEQSFQFIPSQRRKKIFERDQKKKLHQVLNISKQQISKMKANKYSAQTIRPVKRNKLKQQQIYRQANNLQTDYNFGLIGSDNTTIPNSINSKNSLSTHKISFNYNNNMPQMANIGMQKTIKQGIQLNQQGIYQSQQGISNYPQGPSQYGRNLPQYQQIVNSYMIGQQQNQSNYQFVKPKDNSKTIFINEGGVMRSKNSQDRYRQFKEFNQINTNNNKQFIKQGQQFFRDPINNKNINNETNNQFHSFDQYNMTPANIKQKVQPFKQILYESQQNQPTQYNLDNELVNPNNQSRMSYKSVDPSNHRNFQSANSPNLKGLFSIPEVTKKYSDKQMSQSNSIIQKIGQQALEKQQIKRNKQNPPSRLSTKSNKHALFYKLEDEKEEIFNRDLAEKKRKANSNNNIAEALINSTVKNPDLHIVQNTIKEQAKKPQGQQIQQTPSIKQITPKKKTININNMEIDLQKQKQRLRAIQIARLKVNHVVKQEVLNNQSKKTIAQEKATQIQPEKIIIGNKQQIRRDNPYPKIVNIQNKILLQDKDKYSDSIKQENSQIAELNQQNSKYSLSDEEQSGQNSSRGELLRLNSQQEDKFLERCLLKQIDKTKTQINGKPKAQKVQKSKKKSKISQSAEVEPSQIRQYEQNKNRQHEKNEQYKQNEQYLQYPQINQMAKIQQIAQIPIYNQQFKPQLETKNILNKNPMINLNKQIHQMTPNNQIYIPHNPQEYQVKQQQINLKLYWKLKQIFDNITKKPSIQKSITQKFKHQPFIKQTTQQRRKMFSSNLSHKINMSQSQPIPQQISFSSTSTSYKSFVNNQGQFKNQQYKLSSSPEISSRLQHVHNLQILRGNIQPHSLSQKLLYLSSQFHQQIYEIKQQLLQTQKQIKYLQNTLLITNNKEHYLITNNKLKKMKYKSKLLEEQYLNVTNKDQELQFIKNSLDYSTLEEVIHMQDHIEEYYEQRLNKMQVYNQSLCQKLHQTKLNDQFYQQKRQFNYLY